MSEEVVNHGHVLLSAFVNALHGEPKSQRLEMIYSTAINFLDGVEISQDHIDELASLLPNNRPTTNMERKDSL